MNLKKYKISVSKNQETAGTQKLIKPQLDKTHISATPDHYEKLNEDGYVDEETVLEKGDVIFSKVTPLDNTKEGDKLYRDEPEIYNSNVPGVVDRMYVGLKTPDGLDHRETLVRSERFPRVGDKFGSRFGQKGTIGIILDGVDMPHTKEGIRPDLIINPNAIPSRMTIGQLLECVTAKIGAIKGINIDGTPFEDYDVEQTKDELQRLGYNRNGFEYLYNGMTGRRIQAEIFIGPTFYQRLKQLTEDKFHARATGIATSLTRQPPDGRARDGGGRVGEMEKDVMIAHGIAYFLKERMLDCSDIYATHICGICGLFARRESSKTNTATVSDTDTWYCPPCKNYHDIHKIVIPYAFKLTLQEMMAMCIAPRIRFHK
jgi:DNA-directed RNA polymerase II subunit RPB2